MRVTTCNVRNIATAIALLNMALFASMALAEDKPKGPTCQESLMQTTVQANNLTTDRAQKEQALAKEQITSYLLRQQVAALQKELEALKAPKDEPPK